jgi:hypothetical protein
VLIEQRDLEAAEAGPEAKGGLGELIGASPSTRLGGRLVEGDPRGPHVTGSEAGVAQREQKIDASRLLAR